MLTGPTALRSTLVMIFSITIISKRSRIFHFGKKGKKKKRLGKLRESGKMDPATSSESLLHHI